MHNIFYGKTLEEIADFFRSIMLNTSEKENVKVEELAQEVYEKIDEQNEKIDYYNVNEDIQNTKQESDWAMPEVKMPNDKMAMEMNDKAIKMFVRIFDDIHSLHKFLMHILKLCNSSKDDLEIKKLIVKMDKARLKIMRMCGEMNIEVEPNERDFFEIRNYDLALKIARENAEKILDNLILLLFFVNPKEMGGDIMLLMIVMLTSNEKLNELMRNRC